MSAADGTIERTVKIVDNGPATARFNLVLIAEGYRNSELSQFAQDAQSFVDYLFQQAPFNEPDVRYAFNIYRIDVSSTDSGADDPAGMCGGTGATAATYFDATFCGDGSIRRLLTVNWSLALTVLAAQVPEWNQAMVMVNSAIFGGSGGQVAVTSTAGNWRETALHEMGHSAFDLADEYEYYRGCASGETDRNNHPNVEPVEPNVTIDSNRNTIKWQDLIDPATAMPTMSNPDCSQCDTRPSPVPAGTVGAFEGAHYYHCDAYRPEYNCRMRSLGVDFCAVCQRVIRQTMQPYGLPVWTYNRTVIRTHAKHGSQMAWAILDGGGWLRVKPASPDGVANVFAILCVALANHRKVDALIHHGQISQVNLR